MYALISTDGKQYRVTQNQSLKLDKLDKELGDPIVFEKVLLVGDGKETAIGTPYLPAHQVQGVVKAHGRGKKIEVKKFKRRKGYKRSQGHRQDYTEVQITDITPISAGG